eukprot:COSAG01_NODE_6114_length_3843_cov_2.175481_6_plen_69_part_00
MFLDPLESPKGTGAASSSGGPCKDTAVTRADGIVRGSDQLVLALHEAREAFICGASSVPMRCTNAPYE